MNKIKENFTKIYTDNIWGKPDDLQGRKNKKFYSGGGTDPDNDRDNVYMNLIQSYVNKSDINTVVEIGCGDWEVSSRIDWSSVKYTGYDIVKDLINYNNENFGNNNVKFICDDLIKSNNAKADLIIIKDVFQHLPPSFCKDFIKSIPVNFKYNIITNDFNYVNNEIDFGGYCGNNFSNDPFFMNYKLTIQWYQKFKEAGNKQTIILE